MEYVWLLIIYLLVGVYTSHTDWLHDFYVTISRCYKGDYVISFIPGTARLWNSLPLECFPLTF